MFQLGRFPHFKKSGKTPLGFQKIRLAKVWKAVSQPHTPWRPSTCKTGYKTKPFEVARICQMLAGPLCHPSRVSISVKNIIFKFKSRYHSSDETCGYFACSDSHILLECLTKAIRHCRKFLRLLLFQISLSPRQRWAGSQGFSADLMRRKTLHSIFKELEWELRMKLQQLLGQTEFRGPKPCGYQRMWCVGLMGRQRPYQRRGREAVDLMTRMA